VFGMKILILGATGLADRNALAQVFALPAVTQVIAPTRRPLPKRDKLMNLRGLGTAFLIRTLEIVTRK
jgi:hypothetical protein